MNVRAICLYLITILLTVAASIAGFQSRTAFWWCIGLSVVLALVATSTLDPFARFFSWHGNTLRPRLKYVSHHSDERAGKISAMGVPYFVRIKNVQTAGPNEANNVRAGVEYHTATRTQRCSVPKAPWFVIERLGNGAIRTAWKSSVSLKGDEAQSFLLLISGDKDVWISKTLSIPQARLEEGNWEASMTVRSDNSNKITERIRFTVFPDGRLKTDGWA